MQVIAWYYRHNGEKHPVIHSTRVMAKLATAFTERYDDETHDQFNAGRGSFFMEDEIWD